MEFQASLFLYLIIILSSIIHEYSHGWMANALGDPTAKNAGRLTLNPIVHIDLWGTIIMPWFLMILTSGQIFFGYAKPVPFNPYNLRNQKKGAALIAFAGPFSNFLLALIFGLFVRIAVFPPLMVETFLAIVQINLWLMLFNLLPFPPADGSKLLAGFLPYSLEKNLEMINPTVGIIIALVFAFFILPVIIPYLLILLTGLPG